VATVGDGSEALAQLERACPEVIVLDLFLPRMDGRAFLAEQAQRGLCAAVPVVALTGYYGDPDQIAQTARDPGVFAVLPKPFLIDELLAAVASARRAAAAMPPRRESPGKSAGEKLSPRPQVDDARGETETEAATGGRA
jgi:CheY-like chemotaxis protein